MAALVSPVLVGRRTELETLLAALGRAESGVPAVVVVGGEAGVGKTRLVEDAAAQAAERGARVLAGACGQLGGEGLPFAPLVDALRTLARSTEPEELDEVLGPARGELARLLPELDPVASAAPAPMGTQSARLFELVLGVLGRIAAQRPLVLVIEDLHWADRSTLDLVAFLMRTPPAGPVLLAVTYRTDELHRGHPLRPLLAELERVRAIERIELAPFDRAQVAAQLEGILGEPAERDVADRVFERSEGNAFLVEEMLGIVRAGADIELLPPSLRDVLLARTETLPDSVRRTLRLAAVAGRRVPDRLLAAVADVPEHELVEALREAVEHNVLVVDQSGYAFRHALVRDAVYDDLLPAERARAHAAYAEALERAPALAGGEGDAAAALAYHWYAAHDVPRALAAAVEAARHAIDSFAPADAMRHLERALEIWPQVPDADERTGLDRLAVAELAIDAAIAADQNERALALIDDALIGLDRDRERLRVAMLLDRRFEARRWMDRGDAVAELEEAVALVPAEPPTPELAVALASLANAWLLRAEMSTALEISERALAVARATGERRSETRALISMGVARGYLGDPEAALPALREGRAIAEEIGDHDGVLRSYVNLSDQLELLRRHEEAAEEALAGLEVARRVGFIRRYGDVLAFNAAEPLVRLGRWKEAERIVSEGLATASHLWPMILEAHLAIARGDVDSAARQVQRATGTLGSIQADAEVALVKAQLAHVRGDLAAAGESIAALLPALEESRIAQMSWPVVVAGLAIEADAASQRRDLRQAADPSGLASRLAAFADALDRDSAISRGYAELADAERARIDGADGPEVWRTAVAAWRSVHEPYPVAQALVRLAEAELAAGDKEAARDAVAEAAAIARDLGATPVLEDAIALARRARLELGGEAPAVADAPAAERLGLTEREQEVLRLVADGRSNAQIATELFISPKTASVHVSNILGKLGVSSRVEAAAVAHRLGLAAAAD